MVERTGVAGKSHWKLSHMPQAGIEPSVERRQSVSGNPLDNSAFGAGLRMLVYLLEIQNDKFQSTYLEDHSLYKRSKVCVLTKASKLNASLSPTGTALLEGD